MSHAIRRTSCFEKYCKNNVIRDRDMYLPGGANPKESLFNQHKLSDKRKVFQVLMKWSVQM